MRILPANKTVNGRPRKIWRAAVFLVFAGGASAAEMALNPDVRQDTIQQTICVSGYTATVRPSTGYTGGVKKKLLREAGIEESRAGEFELDHIVPLALGGHPRQLGNLQLQPWEGESGAKKKDKLEVKLQCLVCTGAVTLAQAQREIYADWQGALARYQGVKCRR